MTLASFWDDAAFDFSTDFSTGFLCCFFGFDNCKSGLIDSLLLPTELISTQPFLCIDDNKFLSVPFVTPILSAIVSLFAQQ
jgi:hypothetical protein